MVSEVSGKKIFFLGGEGFIGRNLADYFSQQNDCISAGEEKSFFEKRNDVFFLARPYEENIVHESDVIVHLIDNKVPLISFEEQERRLIENIGLDKRHHLIVFSSAVVYANPESEYGQRKRILEKFYSEYCQQNGIVLTVLRLFNAFGSYQIPYRQGSLVGNLIFDALNGKETEINDPESMRDFLYAGDIPKFVEWAIQSESVGVHDIGSGALTSIGELITLLDTKALQCSPNRVYRNKKESIPNRCADRSVVQNIELTGLEDGLRRTVKFYEDNMPIVKRYVQ